MILHCFVSTFWRHKSSNLHTSKSWTTRQPRMLPQCLAPIEPNMPLFRCDCFDLFPYLRMSLADGNETQYREGTMMKQRINRLKLGRRISKEFEVCCHNLRPSLKRHKFSAKFYCSNVNDLSGYASPVTSGTLTVIWWNWQHFWWHTNMFCSCAFQVFRDSLLLQDGLKMQPKIGDTGRVFSWVLKTLPITV